MTILFWLLAGALIMSVIHHHLETRRQDRRRRLLDSLLAHYRARSLSGCDQTQAAIREFVAVLLNYRNRDDV